MSGSGGLMIGGAQDPAERTADDRAMAALGGVPTIHRTCAACTEDEARRSPAAGVIAPGPAPAPASGSAEKAVKSLGSGQPLSAAERTFYEPRFGVDLSAVRLHENSAADKAANAMDASAFTLGADIAFARGARQQGGAPLLAHELAHAADETFKIRRRLRVLDPADPIPRPGGVGVAQSNAEAIRSYLGRICPTGGPTVDARGSIELTPGMCSLLRGQMGGGCDCICDLVDDFTDWRIAVRDAPTQGAYPHTEFDNNELAATPGSGGTGGLIIAPSPNSGREIGAARTSGEIVAMENWEVLMHELCGHARRGAAGAHPEDDPEGVREGHGPVVDDLNRLREDIPGASSPPRGNRLQDPWCGESFFRERGATEWTASQYVEQCRVRREAYLQRMRRERPNDRRYRRRFDISDRLP